MTEVLTSGTPLAKITEIVDFNNPGAHEYSAQLVFDQSALPTELAVTVRLSVGAAVMDALNCVARPVSGDDPVAPASFDTTVYVLSPGTRAELTVNLAAFAAVQAFMVIRATGPLTPGARYPMEVQQYRLRMPSLTAQPPDDSKQRLVGGCTFIIPVAGTTVPTPRHEPSEEHNDRRPGPPLSTPWLAEATKRRWDEMFRESTPGPGVESVTVTNDLGKYAGPCPVTVTFRATIRTSHNGVISFLWLRSDGAIGPVEQITVVAAADTTITRTWRLGGPGFTFNGWQALRILGSAVLDSEPSWFSITCDH